MKKTHARNSICTTLFLLLASAVSAGIINVPADQPTIQAGIDAAVNGDEVVNPPVLVENFNDNNLDLSLWCVFEDFPFIIETNEVNQRLEVSSSVNSGNDATAVIYNCGWALDTTQDFRWKVSFHYAAPGALVGEVGIQVICWFKAEPKSGGGSEYTAVSVSIGRDLDGNFAGTEHHVNGALISEDFGTFTSPLDGTVYFSYHASTDFLTVSSTTYDGVEAVGYSGLRTAAGNTTAGIALGGFSTGPAPAFSGFTAWIDQFDVESGMIVSCPGDTNGDGNVNVTDLLALLGAWGACP